MPTIRDWLVKDEISIQAWSANTYEKGVETQISNKMSAVGGGGGGPAPERMVPAKGASLVGSEDDPSDTSRDFNLQSKKMKAKGMKIDQLDVEDVDASAPPGCEDAVMGLKKKYGEDSSSPFAIAWSMHKAGKCG